MADDIYAPPQSDVCNGLSNDSDLATRKSRFFASFLDALVIMTITTPVMYFTGGFDGISEGAQLPIAYNLAIATLGLIAFILFNGKLLINNGQTIGKKVLGIKIVDLDGNLPTIKKHLIKRYLVFFLPGQVPIAGQLFSMINILFILGKQKRCIHDYAAGTKVVNS